MMATNSGRVKWGDVRCLEGEVLDAYEARVRELEAEGLTRSDAQAVADAEAVSRAEIVEVDGPSDRCTNPKGHEWAYTGTAYGGDDERWHGEGRCYCVWCGADGDA